MFKVKLSSRGQIVIPAEVRHKLGLMPGKYLRLYERGLNLMLAPEVPDPVTHGLGFLKKDLKGCEPDEPRHS